MVRRFMVGMFVFAFVTALPVFAAAPKPKMSTPRVACAGAGDANLFVSVTAGTTGAPAGFSLQWTTEHEFNNLFGGIWPASDTTVGFCKASFSGNAFGSRYNLSPNESTTVEIGDFLFDSGASTTCAQPLACGATYVFRAFAHADSTRQRSDFTTPNLSCATTPCEPTGGCTLTQGYWKTHGPIPTGNNSNMWPVTELALGNVTYTELQLQAILDKPAQGNGLIALAHQLIAAKLNVANGADSTSIAAAIASADAMVGNLVVPPVGGSSLPTSVTSSLTSALDGYNNGLTGPGHCQ